VPQPNGFFEELDGQVVLRMDRNDYNELLFVMGMATGFSHDQPARMKAFIELCNRLNQGNQNYTPYATT